MPKRKAPKNDDKNKKTSGLSLASTSSQKHVGFAEEDIEKTSNTDMISNGEGDRDSLYVDSDGGEMSQGEEK